MSRITPAYHRPDAPCPLTIAARARRRAAQIARQDRARAADLAATRRQFIAVTVHYSACWTVSRLVCAKTRAPLPTVCLAPSQAHECDLPMQTLTGPRALALCAALDDLADTYDNAQPGDPAMTTTRDAFFDAGIRQTLSLLS